MGSAKRGEVRTAREAEDARRLEMLLDTAGGHASSFRNLEGLRSSREALDIARRLGDRNAIGRALHNATLCHYQRGDYVTAIATGLDGLETYSSHDVIERSRALQDIALALLSIEAFDLAQSMAERSVADAREGGDLDREAHAGSVLGAILADRGMFHRARHQFRIAAAQHRNTGDVLRLKKATSNLGHTYRKQGGSEERTGHPSQARLYWTQALRIYRLALGAVRHDADDAIILGAIAECECRLGRLTQARADVRRAVELAREFGDASVLANCRLWEGHILKGMNELAEAERAYEHACEAARGLEHDAILATSLHELAVVVRARGELQRAAQIEERGRSAVAERASFLARIRVELTPLWARFSGAGRLGTASDAA